jgi:hypothetical protein
MSTASRDAILHRLRTELSKGPHVDPPPVHEVWPRQKPAPSVMAEQFAAELKIVQG